MTVVRPYKSVMAAVHITENITLQCLDSESNSGLIITKLGKSTQLHKCNKCDACPNIIFSFITTAIRNPNSPHCSHYTADIMRDVGHCYVFK